MCLKFFGTTYVYIYIYVCMFDNVRQQKSGEVWAKKNTEQIFQKTSTIFSSCRMCSSSSRAKKHENLFLKDSREAREIYTHSHEEEMK